MIPSAPSDAPDSFAAKLARLPKAELHVHLEGSVEPATVVTLAARHGEEVTVEEVLSRYRTPDFISFLNAYKWVTLFLQEPRDYALIAQGLAEQLLGEGVVYAEVTLSVGVMLLRKQDVAANFRAIREATEPYAARGLRLQWIFDAVRQFGALPAGAVADCAIELRDDGVVAFGLGGDELSLPASDFRGVYERVAAAGLRRVAHAGEIGGPQSVRDAIEELGAERIGHGIGAAVDPELMEWLAERAIPLEVCPTSNLRTGALARLLQSPKFTEAVLAAPGINLSHHPLPRLLRAGVPVSLSTDDPAMFETHLNREYGNLSQMELSHAEVLQIAEAGFTGAFLPAQERQRLLEAFRGQAALLGLL